MRYRWPRADSCYYTYITYLEEERAEHLTLCLRLGSFKDLEVSEPFAMRCISALAVTS